jgi:hypothetical protein
VLVRSWSAGAIYDDGVVLPAGEKQRVGLDEEKLFDVGHGNELKVFMSQPIIL